MNVLRRPGRAAQPVCQRHRNDALSESLGNFRNTAGRRLPCAKDVTWRVMSGSLHRDPDFVAAAASVRVGRLDDDDDGAPGADAAADGDGDRKTLPRTG